VKGGIKERFAQLRAMGIRTVMITGDNALTAAAIAAESGVDDYLAQATPEMKLRRIREEQSAGTWSPYGRRHQRRAGARAGDVGVAMNTGTQAAKEAGNMVDLDSNRPSCSISSRSANNSSSRAARSPPSASPTTSPSISPSSPRCWSACSPRLRRSTSWDWRPR